MSRPSLRVVLIDCDYPDYLAALYGAQPRLAAATYAEQVAVRQASLFGICGSLARELRAAGLDAEDVHANNTFLELAWAREQGHRARRPLARALHLITAHGRRLARPCPWRIDYDILARRIQHVRPDVVFVMDMNAIDDAFLAGLKPRVRLIVGQHAASPLRMDVLRAYDIVVSSYAPLIDALRSKGVQAERLDLGFDPAVLDQLGPRRAAAHPVTFVGGLFPIHSSRVRFLEQLAHLVPELRIWGAGLQYIGRESVLRRRYEGEAWGRAMFEILRDSAITLNHHGDIEPFASNMRLFEATGVGSLLVTDAVRELDRLFDIGAEVVTYRTAEECAERIRHHQAHRAEAAAIASRGQRRTLRDHTYASRSRDLADRMRRWLEKAA